MQIANLDDLLLEPRETLDVEVKEWLDLSDKVQRAHLAKEIIALANHGGGYIVVGFKEGGDGQFGLHAARPLSLDAWSQDNVQDIIAKYVDPGFQCQVFHRQRPGSEDRHPIIVVPGGHRSPIRAKSGTPDGAAESAKLVAQRIYIRRPGPNSEEPRTTEEWDRLLDRCVQARQGELLDAMRSIISGVIPTAAPSQPTRPEELAAFTSAAALRWFDRAGRLEAGVPPKLPNGYYDFAVAIDGPFERQGLSDLRRTIGNSVRNHSGWPPFLTLDRAPFSPQPIDGAVEFWRGPDSDGSFDRPAHHDFWRVSPAGLMFTRRGFPEDGGLYNVTPGTTFDLTSPVRRIGEAIMEAHYIAKALDAANANLLLLCSWQGLKGRTLVSHANPNRMLFEGRTAIQDVYGSAQTVAIDALPAALPEVVYAILAPLYELFEFFILPKRLVEEELRDLLSRTFH